METSFTSLQSPIDTIPQQTAGSSKASSIAGSLFGRSQLSSILQYDISSILDDSGNAKSLSGPSDATTVIAAEHKLEPIRCKNVAFDTSCSPIPYLSSPSPGIAPRSILHKQISNPVKRPGSLSMSAMRSSPITPKLDLIHDDWFGLAPLASPESLSEISSISSRTSIAMSLAASIEKCLQGISLNSDLVLEDESELSTPKIMRRTPKISGNLSTCADDWKSVDKYKRMGKIFITNPIVPLHQSTDSSEQSFESASSLINQNNCYQPQRFVQTESSKSADNLDDVDSLITTKLTMSDSAILKECQSNCPKCPCRTSNIDCCKRFDHTKCVSVNSQRTLNSATGNSSSDTYHSAMSSLNCLEQVNISNGTKTKKLESNLRFGVLESHFPAFLENQESSMFLLPQSSPKIQLSSKNDRKVSILTKKRNNSDDKMFSKNESLPLLSSLSEKSSPSFVKRKKYVYPMSPATKRGESNV